MSSTGFVSHARRSGLSASTRAGTTNTMASSVVTTGPAAPLTCAAATQTIMKASHADARA